MEVGGIKIFPGMYICLKTNMQMILKVIVKREDVMMAFRNVEGEEGVSCLTTLNLSVFITSNSKFL